MRLLLAEEGYDIAAGEDAINDFVISVSKGKLQFKEIKSWIQVHKKLII